MLRDLTPHIGMVLLIAAGVYGANYMLKKFPIV